MKPVRAVLEAEAARTMRAGPVEAAIAAHRALLSAYPESSDGWYNLALLERRSRRPGASLAALHEALSRGISGAEEVWLQRALILSNELHDAGEARIALCQALKLAPRYTPAWLNLGNLEEDCGDRDAAETCYRNALRIAPGHPLALARLAGVARLSTPTDPIIDALRSALTQVHGAPLAQADLGFALGSALDRLGDYDAAFDAYVSANRASRIFAKSQHQTYDHLAQERRVDQLIAALSMADCEAARDAPIFICGMVRSGSTLVERMLSRHDLLIAGGEIDTIPTLAGRLASHPEALQMLSVVDRNILAQQYWSEARRDRADGRILIDKQPENIFHLPLIRAIFPNARIIRTVRNPLDNALSAFFLHADPSLSWATDLNDIAHYLAEERRLADHAERVLGTNFHSLRYERLVQDPRREMSAVLAMCMLDWDDRVLNPAAGGDAIKTASVWQVRNPIHRRSCGRWQNYAHRLGHLAVTLEGIE